MNDADRLFARLAIQKSYVSPAEVEEARQYLEKLGSLPVPLSLGVVLQKLGRINRGQIQVLQKEMEAFGFRCSRCGQKAYSAEFDEGGGAPVCGRCRGEEEKPPAAPAAPALSERTVRAEARGGERETRRRESNELPRAGAARADEVPPKIQKAPRLAIDVPPAPQKEKNPERPEKPEPPERPFAPEKRVPSGAEGPREPEAPLCEPNRHVYSGKIRLEEPPPRAAPPERRALAEERTIAAGRARRPSGDGAQRSTTASDFLPTMDEPLATSPRFGLPENRRERVLDLAPRDEAPDPFLGKVLGGVKIERLIGKGGMGTVYRGHQLDLERPVAVKVLAPALTSDPKRVQQFLREAKALGKLEHPNIVTIYTAGKEDETLFIVMQLVEGESVDKLVRREGALAIERACDIVTQAAKGLYEAHEKGIVHRDVKPENLLLAGETIKVVDFGLARMEGDAFRFASGRIVGTPHFMSPEQIDGREVDARTDIYALGATFYYLLTGTRPHEGDTPVDILLKHINETLIPPRERRREVPEELSRLVCKMMVKDASARYQSLREVLRDIEPARRGQSISVELPKEDVRALDIAATAALAAPLVPEPVRIERPRSFRYFAGGLAAAALLAAGIGLGPVRELLADREPEAPRQSAGERAAAREVEEAAAIATSRGVRAALERIKEIVAIRQGTPFASIAEKKQQELEARLAEEAERAANEKLAEVAQLRQQRRPAAAIEALLKFPKEHEGTAGFSKVRAELDAVRLQLASERGQAYVPAGPFISGDDKTIREVDGFYIDLREVTNRDWLAFVRAGGARPRTWRRDPTPEEMDLPVAGMSFEDAQEYARFFGPGKRLPTSTEWEKAARGTDGRRYPWGDEEDFSRANCLEAEVGRPEKVGSRPRGASPYGCLDMAGNVAEWVVEKEGGQTVPLVRGGGWLDHLSSTRAAFFLDGFTTEDAHEGVGLRLAQDAEK
jgi:formylglycine-generating enzyme required for sulfatase activity/predicted Ser/Thr protein kinase